MIQSKICRRVAALYLFAGLAVFAQSCVWSYPLKKSFLSPEEGSFVEQLSEHYKQHDAEKVRSFSLKEIENSDDRVKRSRKKRKIRRQVRKEFDFLSSGKQEAYREQHKQTVSEVKIEFKPENCFVLSCAEEKAIAKNGGGDTPFRRYSYSTTHRSARVDTNDSSPSNHFGSGEDHIASESILLFDGLEELLRKFEMEYPGSGSTDEGSSTNCSGRDRSDDELIDDLTNRLREFDELSRSHAGTHEESSDSCENGTSKDKLNFKSRTIHRQQTHWTSDLKDVVFINCFSLLQQHLEDVYFNHPLMLRAESFGKYSYCKYRIGSFGNDPDPNPLLEIYMLPHDDEISGDAQWVILTGRIHRGCTLVGKVEVERPSIEIISVRFVDDYWFRGPGEFRRPQINKGRYMLAPDLNANLLYKHSYEFNLSSIIDTRCSFEQPDASNSAWLNDRLDPSDSHGLYFFQVHCDTKLIYNPIESNKQKVNPNFKNDNQTGSLRENAKDVIDRPNVQIDAICLDSRLGWGYLSGIQLDSTGTKTGQDVKLYHKKKKYQPATMFIRD